MENHAGLRGKIALVPGISRSAADCEGIVSKVTMIGAVLAIIHLAAYIASLGDINEDGWHRIAFLGRWALLDFPIGLLAIFGYWSGYWYWIEKTFGERSPIAILLVPSHIVDGFLGTVWWFFIPRLIATALRSRAGNYKH